MLSSLQQTSHEIDFETPAILKALAEANRHLGELKGVSASMPNQRILVSPLSLQESQASSADECEGFTKKHQVHTLVYFEEHGYMLLAIEREKQMKKWIRKRKLALIEIYNPKSEGLSEDVLGDV